MCMNDCASVSSCAFASAEIHAQMFIITHTHVHVHA